MNILYINHYAGSVHHGMEFRPYYMATEWVKAGHNVTMVAADFSHIRGKNPNIEKSFTEENIDGVNYLWVKTNSYNGNGLGRIRNILSFTRQLKRRAKSVAEKYNPDVVIASSTYPYDIHPAEKIAKFAGAKLFFEIHDIWPDTLIELAGFSRKNPAIKHMQKTTDYAFKKSHRVISILPNADIYLEERGVEAKKFRAVPNGVMCDSVAEELPESVTSLIEKLRNENRFITMYAGGHAISNSLDDLVAAAKNLDDNHAIVLIGDGVEKPRLAEESKNLTNIFFVEKIRKNQVLSVLKLADALVISAVKCSLYRYGAGMNKFYDYQLAAKPIINAVEAVNDPVADSNCGVSVPSGDGLAIAKAIKEISQKTPQEREEMGKRGYEYVHKHHDYKHLAQKFLQALEE